MTTDSETTEQYLNFVRSRFLISVLVIVSRDYELGRVSDFGGPQSRTGLIFYVAIITVDIQCYFCLLELLNLLT